MSFEVKRGNKYEDASSEHTVAAMREMVTAVSEKFPDIKYRAYDKRGTIRSNFDQLKRLLDQPDETVLSESEFGLAEGLLKNIQETLELPITLKQRNDVDTRRIPVVLQAVARTTNESSPVATETIQVAPDVEEDIDFTSEAQIEKYDQELLERTKNAFSNQPFFKEHELINGLKALGAIRVVFAHWDRALQQIKSNLRNNKEVDTRLYVQLNKHYDKIHDLIEIVNAEVVSFHESSQDLDTMSSESNVSTIETAENNAVAITTVETKVLEPLVLRSEDLATEASKITDEGESGIDVPPAAPLPPLRLTNEERVFEEVPVVAVPEQLQESTPSSIAAAPEQKEMNEVPRTESDIKSAEAEKSEFAEVQRMQTSINQIEEEMKQLQQTVSWRPSHEAGNTQAMIDQFDRTLSDYYEQPSAELFERLKNTFTTIEVFYNEAKESSVDVMVMLADMDTYQRDLPRLERLPSTQPFERDVLRSTIENFRGLYARYIRAEAGEEKNILLRQMVKMHENVKQAHQDAESFVMPKPVTEVDSLKSEVSEWLKKPTMSDLSRQALIFVQTEMLTRLGLLMPGDPEYNELLKKTEEAITAAVQLSQDIPATPTPVIENAANENIAPRWSETEKKLTRNRALVAALVLATVSVMHSDRLSEQSVNVQIASTGPLSDIGLDAKWGNGEPSTVLVPVRREVRPNTGKEVPEESKAAAATNVEVIPEVTVARADSADVIVSPSGSADTNMYEIGSAEEADPKSPAYQESIAPTESVASGNNVVEVLRGNEATYPDRAINPLLAAVDVTGIPEVLANKLRAEEKEAFLSDANRLKAAGVVSGQRGTTFPGEKINYSDPVKRLEQRFNEYRQYLNVPHTEVAESGDTRTSLTLESYARDLKLIPKEDQLNLASAAVEAYYATAEGRETLNGEDKDALKPGAVVPLQGVAPFLAAEIANYVRKTVAADNTESSIDTVVETDDESGSASEVIEDKGEPGEVTSPEEYPGGVIAFSQAYNQLLESFGIAIKAPAMFDSWFTVDRAEYNNRELLGMTVGEITNIMMQGPADVMRELNARKISPEAADAVYQLVIEARKNGLAPYATDSTIPLEEVIKRNVLARASTTK